MRSLLLLAAEPAVGSTFGARDLAGLVFIGVAIILIWVGFLQLPERGGTR